MAVLGLAKAIDQDVVREGFCNLFLNTVKPVDARFGSTSQRAPSQQHRSGFGDQAPDVAHVVLQAVAVVPFACPVPLEHLQRRGWRSAAQRNPVDYCQTAILIEGSDLAQWADRGVITL